MHAKRAAFLAFGEQGDQDTKDPANQKPEQRQRNQPRPCVCGVIHLYKECPFLNPDRRAEGWKPDQRTEQKIKNTLTSNKKIRDAVYRHTSYRLPAQSNQPNTANTDTNASNKPEDLRAAFYALSGYSAQTFVANEGSDWLLYNSFLLDSAANIHICHDKSRFKSYTPNPHDILAGGGIAKMLGTGDVDITVQHPTGDRIVTLKNVSYGPDFPANLVSLKLANKSGIYWDQANSRLTQGNQT